MDAVHFVPQSRPRLFIVPCATHRPIPAARVSRSPIASGTRASRAPMGSSRRAHERVGVVAIAGAAGEARPFSDLIEDEPAGVAWHTAPRRGAFCR